MSAWQHRISELRSAKTPAVLVSVDSIVGSTPREAGAKMIVTATRLYGTIGGGNLEYQAWVSRVTSLREVPTMACGVFHSAPGSASAVADWST